MSDVTSILEAIDRGDLQAPEQLLHLVYDELRKLATVKLPVRYKAISLFPLGNRSSRLP